MAAFSLPPEMVVPVAAAERARGFFYAAAPDLSGFTANFSHIVIFFRGDSKKIANLIK